MRWLNDVNLFHCIASDCIVIYRRKLQRAWKKRKLRKPNPVHSSKAITKTLLIAWWKHVLMLSELGAHTCAANLQSKTVERRQSDSQRRRDEALINPETYTLKFTAKLTLPQSVKCNWNRSGVYIVSITFISSIVTTATYLEYVRYLWSLGKLRLIRFRFAFHTHFNIACNNKMDSKRKKSHRTE